MHSARPHGDGLSTHRNATTLAPTPLTTSAGGLRLGQRARRVVMDDVRLFQLATVVIVIAIADDASCIQSAEPQPAITSPAV